MFAVRAKIATTKRLLHMKILNMADREKVKKCKDDLRAEMTKKIEILTANDRKKQSSAIFNKLVEHDKLRDSDRVFIYLSTTNEIDTLPILKHLFNQKKTVYIPLVLTKAAFKELARTACTRMVMVRLSSIEMYEKLNLNHYGIKEFKVDEIDFHNDIAKPQANQIDLFLVPGVAFTIDGQRLGHGKGYYDEFLNWWSKQLTDRRNLHTIGLCFREQIVATTHSRQHLDFKLDEILTVDE